MIVAAQPYANVRNLPDVIHYGTRIMSHPYDSPRRSPLSSPATKHPRHKLRSLWRGDVVLHGLELISKACAEKRNKGALRPALAEHRPDSHGGKDHFICADGIIKNGDCTRPSRADDNVVIPSAFTGELNIGSVIYGNRSDSFRGSNRCEHDRCQEPPSQSARSEPTILLRANRELMCFHGCSLLDGGPTSVPHRLVSQTITPMKQSRQQPARKVCRAHRPETRAPSRDNGLKVLSAGG